MALPVTGSDVLQGVRVLEFSAIGPVPWGVLLLAYMGAHITRVVRPGAPPARGRQADIGRHDVCLDLKSPEGLREARALVQSHDVAVEGLRPGAMERLGLGPAHCHDLNPALVYARVTGWGQTGPLALRAGHDINYIALSGALHAIGPRDGAPVVPLNLIGDYGGGGAFMLIGILGALHKARATGRGSVIDAAMLDGAATLMGLMYERHGAGEWRDVRGSNPLDGGAPWYGVYRTRDGGHMAVGAIEPQFYRAFIEGLGLDETRLPDRADRTRWDELRARFEEAFLTCDRDEWTARFEATDACVTPVLSLSEAPLHPHNRARATFVQHDGIVRPNSAPRFASLAPRRPD
ncbi:carnitine dehydratase [Bordetella bronchiseptica]|nr:carnitine dehydratase [Bordetella bronchiseptica]